ncbi:MAG: hypothetical protein L3J19_05840 [Sulfurimonas sp.]|nr:hypothetical protein [Sulfurimonas sp.]
MVFGVASEKMKHIKSVAKEYDGRKNMLNITLPPLSVIYLKKIS